MPMPTIRTARALDREEVAAIVAERDALRAEVVRLRRDLGRTRTERDELRAELDAVPDQPHVLELADGRRFEFESGAEAVNYARRIAFAGVETRVRYDGEVVWDVPRHGSSVRRDGTRQSPRLRVRFG